MNIIVFEGIDKAGKKLQSTLLEGELRHRGLHVVRSEFHRYDSPTGKLIQQWLYGEWDVCQKTIELVMAADKQAQQNWFSELEQKGVDFLILDRYTLSQDVYALAKGMDPQWMNQLQRYMRQPDLEILLDIPAEVSVLRKGKHRGGEPDRYEKDKAYLETVRQVYLEAGIHINNSSVKEGTVFVIDGTQTSQDVYKEVLSAVEEHFNFTTE